MAVSMHWFRRGLRLTDNPALRASTHGATAVYPVYVLDSDSYELRHCSALRANFLVECLQDLNSRLVAAGSRLYVVAGDPVEELPKLWRRWGITRITYELDQSSEPYAVERDAKIFAAANAAGVEVSVVASEHLHDLRAYERAAGKGGVSTSYGSFQKLFAAVGAPAKPLPTLEQGEIPSASGRTDGEDDSNKDMRVPCRATELPWPRSSGFVRGQAAPPGAEAVVTPVWTAADCSALTPAARGGETAALAHLENFVRDVERVALYDKPKTSCVSLKASTTLLSPYLAWGVLSPRTFWHAVEAARRSAKAKAKTVPPVSLHGQLMWRDFSTLMARRANAVEPGSWSRIDGNSLCRPIPWSADPDLLAAWKEGRTGYPWIDACMTQLRREGWIHHLGRHAVACFLTRGDLWQSWEHGAAHFEEQLLDADYAINGFNWLWLSCSQFFYQFFRCYSPIAFQKKKDPSGAYIRRHLPVLARMPDRFIYEPWNAPISVQKAAGCVVGVDYPRPVVDHKIVSKANMAKMKAAYDALKKSSVGVSSSSSKAAAPHKRGASSSAGISEKKKKKKKELKQTKLAFK